MHGNSTKSRRIPRAGHILDDIVPNTVWFTHDGLYIGDVAVRVCVLPVLP